ncbi:MAG TPA: T9SS type A sorting domain-containing protein [Flavipsychrobacter sp.]
MKRIYLLMILFVAAIGNVSAQRSINLEVTLVKPTASTIIEVGKSVDMLAVIKNLGPDSLKMSDSTLWFWTLSGTPLPFPIGSNQGTFWNRFNRSLKVNDTFHLNYPGRSFNYSQTVDSNRRLCINAIPNFDGGGNDTISDPALANNSDCVNLMFKKSPVGIAEAILTVAGENKALIYPNPASNEANIAVKMSYYSEVTVRVMDIAGRTVMVRDMGKLEIGDHIMPFDVSSLQNGVYFYQVQMGNNVASGKLMIAK